MGIIDFLPINILYCTFMDMLAMHSTAVFFIYLYYTHDQQEGIPVGCVPTAH